MWVEEDSVRIQLIPKVDEQLENLKSGIPEWRNLSEKIWYPEYMPDELTFRIEYEKQVVGAIQLINIRWFNRKAEIRIWLIPKVRKKGLAQTALRELINLAFRNLNFHRLEAEVYSFNLPARNLFNKLGFVEEGILREAKFTDGKYHDIIRFGLLKNEFLKTLD